MRIAPGLLVLALTALTPALAPAQRVPPFFGAAGTAYDPEIGVVNSGQVLDAQVAVSPRDLKYVTINARASNAQLLALREFTPVGSGVRRGFVGANGNGGGGGDVANGAPRRGNADRARPRARRPAPNAAQEEQDPLPPLPCGVLARPGMTRVGRFED